MIDPFSGAIRAASMQSMWAAPLAFTAGAVSSAGPCVAPRFIAIAGLASGKERGKSAAVLLAFISGLIVAYSALGAALSLLAEVGAFSSVLYALVAVAMSACGLVSLFRKPHHCDRESRTTHRGGIGAAFLLGASFTFVVSPCCTPLISAIAAYSASSGNILFGALVLACFAAGHALPLAAAGACAGRVSAILSRASLQDAAQTAAAALMLSVGAYYAVLA